MKRRLSLMFCIALAAVPLAFGVSCSSAGSNDSADLPAGSESAAICVGSPGAPVLYHDTQRESPGRADPGDVLLLAGSNFRSGAVVVYQAIANTTQALPVLNLPLPSGKTATLGTIVPLTIDDNAVRVVLPQVMTTDQSYALWVANRDSACGGYNISQDRVLINDARPMWISPGPSATMTPVSPYPYVFVSAIRPGFANREIKIVGRNLQAATSQVTRVKLVKVTSPNETLIVNAAIDPAQAVNRYVARVALPIGLVMGDYDVSVSRDGTSWVQIASDPALSPPGSPMRLTVIADPPVRFQAIVSAYSDSVSGPCSGLDDVYDPVLGRNDDTLCITRAIEDASRHTGGGDVVFPAGTWHVNLNCWGADIGNETSITDSYPFTVVTVPPLGPTYSPCIVRYAAISDGSLKVPKGVSLVAQGAVPTDPATIQTTILTGAVFDNAYINWNTAHSMPRPNLRYERASVFGLLGNNVVRGLRFYDSYNPTISGLDGNGNPYPAVTAPGDKSLSFDGDDITITSNFFDGTMALGGINPRVLRTSLLGIGVDEHVGLIITGNRVGVYENSIVAGVVEDSVISGNKFLPGALIDPVAVGIAGARHLDISSNDIDGTDTTYTAGNHGFRAGIFLSSVTAEENILISNNTFECVGNRVDAAGVALDGEAITVDSNKDRQGFKTGLWVVPDAMNPSSVLTVSVQQGACYDTINNVALPIEACFVTADCVPAMNQTKICAPGDALLLENIHDYVGRWMHVTIGPGLGQTRKVSDASRVGGSVKLTVSPAFDVAPTAASRILVTEQAWQLYVVHNTIDDNNDNGTRCPLPATYGGSFSGGLIGFFGATADSVIESNVQINTQGITMNAAYSYAYTPLGMPSVSPGHSNQFFNEVRGNTIINSFNAAANGTAYSGNHVGGGIGLNAQVGVIASGQLVPTPTSDYMGFGNSVAYNTITNAALIDQRKHRFAASVLVSTGGDWDIEAEQPAYVDTMIFGNVISMLPSPWWHNAGLGPQVETVAISNGEKDVDTATGAAVGPGDPNYPLATLLCRGRTPAVGVSMAGTPTPPSILDTPYASNASSLVQCDVGCRTSGGQATAPDDFFNPRMVGCGGAVTWDNRQNLCSAGFSPCTAAAWNTYRGVLAPTNDYWTADNLHYAGISTACQAVASGGTSCGVNRPMRVCKPGGTDGYGNTCTWTGCGLNTTTSQYFGGCTSNLTAGTLCCAN